MSIREKIVLSLSIAGLILSAILVAEEIKLPGYNPSLSGIPMSHIFSNAFVLIALSALFLNKFLKKALFIFGATVGSAVAIYFSVTHLLLINLSPSLLSISASYIFVSLFAVSIVAQALVIKKEK